MKFDMILLPVVTRDDLQRKIQDISNTLDTIRKYHYSPFRGISAIASSLLFLASWGFLDQSSTSQIAAETTDFLLILSFLFIPGIFIYYLWKIDTALSKYPKLFGLDPRKDLVYFEYRRDLIGKNSIVFIFALIVFLVGLFILLAIFSNIQFPIKTKTLQEYLPGEIYKGFVTLVVWLLSFLFVPLLLSILTKLEEVISIQLRSLKIRQPWRLHGTRFFYPIIAFALYIIIFIVYMGHFYGSTIPQILTMIKDSLMELIQIPAFYMASVTLIWMFGEIISQLSKILVESQILGLYSKLYYLADLTDYKEPVNEAEFMVFYYEHIEKYSKVSIMNIFLFFPVWIYVPSIFYLKYLEKMHRIPGIKEAIKHKLTKINNALNNKFSDRI